MKNLLETHGDFEGRNCSFHRGIFGGELGTLLQAGESGGCVAVAVPLGVVGGLAKGKTTGKPWENPRKMMVAWDLMGFSLWQTFTNNFGKIHHFDGVNPVCMAIFESYVSYVNLPEGN